MDVLGDVATIALLVVLWVAAVWLGVDSRDGNDWRRGRP
jgi:hypothetical protein